MTTVAQLRLDLETRDYERRAQQVQQANDRISDSANQVDQRVQNVDRSMRRASRQFRQFLRFTAGLAGVGSTAVALTQTTRAIAGFGDQMATLRGVAIRSNQSLEEQARQFDALRQTALTAGRDLGFGATASAEGLLFLARAGLDVQEQIAALPSSLALASAGNLQLGEAADIASNAMTQFRLSAADVPDIVDALVVVSNRANTDVRQLGQALSFAGPVAALFGENVQFTTAALGVLGDGGIQATRAGVSLRSSLLQLAGPTKSAAAAINELGTSVDRLDPAQNTLSQILDELARVNLTAADNLQRAATIVGSRNVPALAALIDFRDRVRDLTEATEEFSGEAERNARIQQDTLGGAWRALRQSAEALAIALGDAGLTRFLRSVADGLSAAADATSRFLGTTSSLDGRLRNINASYAEQASEITRVIGQLDRLSEAEARTARQTEISQLRTRFARNQGDFSLAQAQEFLGGPQLQALVAGPLREDILQALTGRNFIGQAGASIIEAITLTPPSQRSATPPDAEEARRLAEQELQRALQGGGGAVRQLLAGLGPNDIQATRGQISPLFFGTIAGFQQALGESSTREPLTTPGAPAVDPAVAARVQELERAMEGAGEDTADASEEAAKKVKAAQERLEETIENFGLNLGDAVGFALEDALLGGEIDAILQQFVADVQRTFLRAFVTDPLRGFVAGLAQSGLAALTSFGAGSSTGNASAGIAAGGVTGGLSPATLAQPLGQTVAQAQIAQASIAGFGLGPLGTPSAPARPSVFNDNRRVTVVVSDQDSFRRSRRQMDSDTRRQLARTQR